MDKNKFNAIAHTYLKYDCPLHTAMVEEVTDLMHLEPGKRIIDVGCAKGEILIRMAELCQVAAIGIDTTPQFIEIAHKEIASRVPAADITLYETPVHEYQTQTESFDAVMCLNSAELYGGYDEALQGITKLAKPGGIVMMGDFYWRGAPNPSIQSRIVTHNYQSAVQAGIAHGLIPLYVTVCTEVDLDRYMWLQSYGVEGYAQEHPDDVDVPALLERSRSLCDEYIQFGRDALGFGLFLYRKQS
jgi:ubiquinone/menaquinone biosynthesis C-methylase UbiE